MPENPLGGVDRAGYILSRDDQHNLTFLYVENGDSMDANSIFEQSHRVPKEYCISADRIDKETT